MHIGHRLALRPIKIEDSSLFFKWLSDPEITEGLDIMQPKNQAEEEEWIVKYLKANNHSNRSFAIELSTNKRLIGICSLCKIDSENGIAELTIIIGEKELWGMGYGFEATVLLVNFGFEEIGLNLIYTGAYDFNLRSIKNLQKAGFKPKKGIRKAIFKKNALHYIISFELFRSEWFKL